MTADETNSLLADAMSKRTELISTRDSLLGTLDALEPRLGVEEDTQKLNLFTYMAYMKYALSILHSAIKRDLQKVQVGTSSSPKSAAREKLENLADAYLAANPPVVDDSSSSANGVALTPTVTSFPLGREGYRRRVVNLHALLERKQPALANTLDPFDDTTTIPPEGSATAGGFDKKYRKYMTAVAEQVLSQATVPTKIDEFGALYDDLMKQLQTLPDVESKSKGGDQKKGDETIPNGEDEKRWGKNTNVDVKTTVNSDEVSVKVRVRKLDDWTPANVTDGLLRRLRILTALQYETYNEYVSKYVVVQKAKGKWTPLTTPFRDANGATLENKRTSLLQHYDALIDVWKSAEGSLDAWANEQATKRWAQIWAKVKSAVPVAAWSVDRAAIEATRTDKDEKTKAFTKKINATVKDFDIAVNVFVDAALDHLQVQATGGWSDEHDDEEDDDDVEGGSDTDEQEEGEGGSGGKPLVLYEPSVRRVLMSMLLEDERASAATCADRFCRRDFSRCRLPCCPADRRLLGRCAEAELRELVYALHPLLRRAW
jgi:hypothetical protein